MCKLNFNENKSITKFVLLLAVTSLLSACATTQKGKIFEAMLVGSTVGAIYGASRPEFKEENALMFGALTGLAATATVVAMDDTDKKLKDFEAKVKFLDEAASSTHKQTSLVEEVPEEFRALLESQTYEIYQIKRWARKGEKYLVKETELIELTGRRER